MACCNKETQMTRAEFLIQKGKNFKQFIMKYKPDDDVLEYMAKFDEKNVLSSILTLLVPLKATGNQDKTIEGLLEKLTIPGDEVQSVREKIGRYFDMFIEIVLSTS